MKADVGAGVEPPGNRTTKAAVGCIGLVTVVACFVAFRVFCMRIWWTAAATSLQTAAPPSGNDRKAIMSVNTRRYEVAIG